ncbi:PIR protein [Plasmodium sp.]|nr:PIR protein [Plasmodium sp.]
MKLHYSKTLLFFLPLNILVSSSYENNNNKLYITSYTPTNTSRMLSECDLYMPNYDDDADMKSVKEIFDRQTSQRFDEYNERMIKNRKICKEQCDKDIQEIIVKDKIDKSLEEKVEKVCLKCGCGLGGVAAGVGLFGGLGTYGWKIGATAAAIDLATQEGIKEGIQVVLVKIKDVKALVQLKNVPWKNFIYESNYKTVEGLVEAVKDAMASIGKPCTSHASERACSGILNDSNYWLGPVVRAGKEATVLTTENAKTAKLGEVTTVGFNAYSAIGYSVTTILIIVLVMVIIYLILRYRRKKKMNKKAQYTKLLNQ